MAKFLVQVSYTADGVRGLIKEGGFGRRTAVQKTLDAMGGKLEAFYFGFGDTDAYVICDLPDAVVAVAVSLAVNATGAVNAKVTPLLTVEEVDAACRKSVAYRAPGA